MSAGRGSSALLLDTNILVWAAIGDRRLPRKVVDMLGSGTERLLVSAVIAWEYEDLHRRGRLPSGMSFDEVRTGMDLELLDFPGEAWRVMETLPNLHRDPVDRMLVAHATVADLILVTGDAIVRDYPVRTFW